MISMQSHSITQSQPTGFDSSMQRSLQHAEEVHLESCRILQDRCIHCALLVAALWPFASSYSKPACYSAGLEELLDQCFPSMLTRENLHEQDRQTPRADTGVVSNTRSRQQSCRVGAEADDDGDLGASISHEHSSGTKTATQHYTTPITGDACSTPSGLTPMSSGQGAPNSDTDHAIPLSNAIARPSTPRIHTDVQKDVNAAQTSPVQSRSPESNRLSSKRQFLCPSASPNGHISSWRRWTRQSKLRKTKTNGRICLP
ncbi:hypothetical protein MRB53_036913 [Persea americana]|nr:hypothetical protein MRB53_036913 [Persea americana]